MGFILLYINVDWWHFIVCVCVGSSVASKGVFVSFGFISGFERYRENEWSKSQTVCSNIRVNVYFKKVSLLIS